MISMLDSSVMRTLSHLELTEEEKITVDFIYSTSLMTRHYGGDKDMLEAISGCWESAKGVTQKIKEDWALFVQEKLFSKEELNFLLSDESPYYGLSAKGKLAPHERFALLMSDVCYGVWAPKRMREAWEQALVRHDGDSLAAQITLEMEKEAADPAL